MDRWFASATNCLPCLSKLRSLLHCPDQERQARAAPLGSELVERTNPGRQPPGITHYLPEPQTPAHSLRLQRDMKDPEPWFLLTNLPEEITRRQVLNRYAERFEIEEAFKDVKWLQRLEWQRVKKPEIMRTLAPFRLSGLVASVALHGQRLPKQRCIRRNSSVGSGKPGSICSGYYVRRCCHRYRWPYRVEGKSECGSGTQALCFLRCSPLLAKNQFFIRLPFRAGTILGSMGKTWASVWTGLLLFASFSSSTHYGLNSYSVGPVGTSNSHSQPTYYTQSTGGEVAGNSTSSTHYNGTSGNVQTEQLAVPQAPTVSNGGGSYTNYLLVTLNDNAGTNSYPTDVTFSIRRLPRQTALPLPASRAVP